jgi:TPR repeat protein
VDYKCAKIKKKALKWYTKAAAYNCGNGQFLLAAMYLQGDVVEKNIPYALELLGQSLKNGFKDAQGLISRINANACESL